MTVDHRNPDFFGSTLRILNAGTIQRQFVAVDLAAQAARCERALTIKSGIDQFRFQRQIKATLPNSLISIVEVAVWCRRDPAGQSSKARRWRPASQTFSTWRAPARLASLNRDFQDAPCTSVSAIDRAAVMVTSGRLPQIELYATRPTFEFFVIILYHEGMPLRNLL